MSAATAGPLPPSSNIVATVEKDIVLAPAVTESTDTDAASSTGDTGDRTQQQQEQERQSPSSSTMDAIASYCSMVNNNLEYLADQLMKKSQKELDDEAILDEAIEEAVRERIGCNAASNLGKALFSSCTSGDWDGGWSQSGAGGDGTAGAPAPATATATAATASNREGGGSNCTVATHDVSTSVFSDESTCVNSNRAPQSQNYVILDHTPVDDVGNDEFVNNKPTSSKLRSLFSLRRSSQQRDSGRGTDNNNNNDNNNSNRSSKWRSIRFGQKRAGF